MFCIQCGSSLIVNAKFCHVCGQTSSPVVGGIPVSVSETVSVENTVASTTPKATTTTPNATSQSQTVPVSFEEYRRRKETERSSRFKPKAKKAKIETKGKECKDKTPSEVTISIGLRKLRDDDLKFVRGSSLPLTVRPSIGAEELLKKAAEKIVKFNSGLTGGLLGFTLLYPDRTKVNKLPGSSESFTLEKYKREIGKIYSRLTFHVCKTEDYLEFLCKPSYCSDSDPDFADKINKV